MPDSSFRVGGFVPFTSIDYPGELAAVVFCQGCPWRCHYCHNRHLLPANGHELLNWRKILEALEQRRGYIDAVVFSGGEPLAQAALERAISSVKDLGFKVGLHTAGCYPQRLKKLLPLLNWVGLDIKQLPNHYATITGIAGSGEQAWQSLEFLVEAGTPLQVRTTCFPGIPDDHLKDLTRQLAEMGVCDHRIQEYRAP
ncbi:anaerobic ribonucleoside-triphosphate reductase activating protein [Thiolapillus brandeum]|uniref:Pyruvate formate lyase activating enzyme n=1 Tax=Thiolapillus brandeum TaxID=1076588 RepID=A0A7U6GGP8_9GAMM|nr:anaerobic ribonucleoside-triphosphate reductase activating protein [Thiolapillus brandeum]BAO43301.1 pyruvate formate lyase activating enzyme [Thiolapillus brandeum]